MKSLFSVKTGIMTGVAATAMMVASSAFAVPITLPNGGINIHLNGVEQFTPTNTNTCPTCGAGGTSIAAPAYNGAETPGPLAGGEGVWGVYVIDTLQPAVPAVANSELSPNGGPFWVNGGSPSTPGNQILAMVHGIQNISLAGVGGATATSSQYGVIDLYWWNSNNQTDANTATTGGVALRNNDGHGGLASGYSGYTCAVDNVAGSGCYFLASFDLVPGGYPAVSPTATVYSSANPSLAFSGAGYFEGEVNLAAGGLWAAGLANDYFTLNNPAFGSTAMVDPSDLNGVTDFRPCSKPPLAKEGCTGWHTAAGGGGVGLRISDPVQMMSKVPEPGTLSLLGFGLLFSGYVARRRKAA